ncbi:MAG: DUF2029 domain-containing protein [Pseudolabrys sp.]|nr:DUF2029 domain-containing protein [Pseudolabrys sp.]
MALSDAPTAKAPKWLELTCFALIVAQATYLVAAAFNSLWIAAPDGHGAVTDFVNVWAAGKLTLQGLSASAYDWPAHKAMEEVAIGHAFDGYFGWHYPPMFLFAAATLALCSYPLAFAGWLIVTFPAYIAAVRTIIGDRTGYVFALAFPAILSNFIVGQNGFLTAGLLGGTLYFIELRPLLAGILLGLLTYKPHFGLLFPFVLAASGHWRVFIAAGVTAAIIAAASWLAFGTETWIAFFGSISHTSQAFLSDGWANFGKLQTAFGLTRVFGGSETMAWALQATVALAVAAAVISIWRSKADRDLKAAALGVGTLLATPYLYTYDLVTLAVPLAFLIRLGRRDGFLLHEIPAIAFACALIAVFPFLTLPVGFAAVAIVAVLVVQRSLGAPEPGAVTAR